MKKITPSAMREVYLRAAEFAQAQNAYGCYAISTATALTLPYLTNDDEQFNSFVRRMTGLFTSLFRNDKMSKQARECYGEFGTAFDDDNQTHRVTALCLMAEIIKDYA